MATQAAPQFDRLSDSDLIAAVAHLAHCERSATAALVASLVEFDERRLYLPEGFPSLFAYCTQRLHFSEHAAYHRIEAARAAHRFPVILKLLEEGDLTLTAVGLLRPHLTEANHLQVLGAAKHRNKRAVEALVAGLHARPDVAPSIRKLPERREHAGAESQTEAGRERVSACDPPGLVTAAVAEAAEAPAFRPALAVPAVRPPVLRALSPARYQVQMTVSAETHAKLRHAQDLLRHVVPNGDPAVIFDRALTLLVRDLERAKFAARKGHCGHGPAEGPAEKGAKMSAQGRDARPGGEPADAPAEMPKAKAVKAAEADVRPSGKAAAGSSRRIPARVKREVWARDGGQCAFVGAAGRCSECGFLEFHHEVPYAAGGKPTASNVSLRCRQHNAHEAELFFGPGAAVRRGAHQLGPDRVDCYGITQDG